jgi:tetratricopeptide (TPR) repeat protein
MTPGCQRTCGMVLLVLLVCCPGKASGQETARPDHDVIRQAKELQFNLDYDEAEKGLRTYLDTQPDDLPALNLLASVILYREMHQRGLLESQLYGNKGDAFKPKQPPLSAEFQQSLVGTLDRAQAAAERRLQHDPRDKDAMYWAGVTHGTRGTLEFALRRAWTAALHEARDATRYHRELMNLDPSYVDAQLIVGINDYIVGSLPWYIKMLAALAGAHGDRTGGLAKVQYVAESGHYAREDAGFMLDVLYRREKRFPEALAIVKPMAQQYPRNFLLQLELASLYRELMQPRNAADVYDGLVAKYQSGEVSRLPAAKVMWLAGQVHEALQERDKALEMYEQAGKVGSGAPFNYRAQFAAGVLYAQMNRQDDARRKYEQVAQAAPDSEEGRLAKKALRR